MSSAEAGDSTLAPEVIESLVEKARADGEIPAEEVVKALKDVELTPDLIDEVVSRLDAEGIKLDEDVTETSAVDLIDFSKNDSPTAFKGSIADPVRAYLQTIGTIKLLTTAQERQLAEVMVEGQKAADRLYELTKPAEQPSAAELAPLRDAVSKGLDARRRLVEANLRLVVSVAKRYRHRGLSFLDLIQEGNAGLVRAVEKFDHTHGFKLSTYATWWIRQALSRAVADYSRTIRIPVHVFESLNRLLRMQRTLMQEHGKEPSIEDLAKRMQLPERRIKELLAIDTSTVSLEPVGPDSAGIGDTLSDLKTETPAAAVDRQALSEALREALGTLSEREQELMRMRFGLDDGQPQSLDAVGKLFGVSRERVRQIETKTLAKLRGPLSDLHLEEFLNKD